MRDARSGYTSIAELAARSGESVPCAGNLPVKLDDPDTVWFIDQGAVNLFLVEFRDGVEQAAPQHLLRRESGRLIPGVAPDEPGEGKDTTLSGLKKRMPGAHFIVTATTRPIRPGEIDGVDYHFVDKSRFADMIEQGEFLEYANVYGDLIFAVIN